MYLEFWRQYFSKRNQACCELVALSNTWCIPLILFFRFMIEIKFDQFYMVYDIRRLLSMNVRDDDSQDREWTFSFLTMFSAHVVWCRRTDELVDGPNASHITPTALDRWEARLEDLFQGRPFDMMDAALADTVGKFPVDIQVRQYFQNQSTSQLKNSYSVTNQK